MLRTFVGFESVEIWADEEHTEYVTGSLCVRDDGVVVFVQDGEQYVEPVVGSRPPDEETGAVGPVMKKGGMSLATGGAPRPTDSPPKPADAARSASPRRGPAPSGW
jgi:hypothetical protein